MEKQQNLIDWSKCILCQRNTMEKLRSTKEGQESLALLLPQFAELNVLDFDIQRLTPTGDTTLQSNLFKNNASYHHTCSSKYNKRMLNRASEKYKKSDIHLKSPPCKRRSEAVKEDEEFNLSCCFCNKVDLESNLHAAGTLHATKSKANTTHVNTVTEKWKSMAAAIEDDTLLCRLSRGDVTSNEIYYHKNNIKPCLTNFHNRYKMLNQKQSHSNDTMLHDSDWIKISALNKIFYHMCEVEKFTPNSVFEIKELEGMYIELLQSHNIDIQSHVSRFSELLLSRCEELEKRNIGKKVVIYFKSTANIFLNEAISEPSSFLRLLHKVIIPLRKIISVQENHFDGSFDEDSQLRSVPIQLLTLVSMLIDGPNIENKNFTQASLTVSQLIVSNFKKKKQGTCPAGYRRTNRNFETPIQLYSSLKLYSTFRSRSIIDHLFKIGLCSSYDRILELTKSLSDDMVNQYLRDGIFCPSKLKKSIFTMIAKDNCDLNATSSTATMHYHGTSITIMQYPTEENIGEDMPKPFINIAKNSATKKVHSLPTSYTETKPIYLSKGPLFAPKCVFSISTQYLNNELYEKERLNEIEWLDEINNQLVLNNTTLKSWSKHHANIQRTKTGKNGINVILPLIPKAVHTLDTQYHCMDITKRTIAFLNPDQTPVDVCDQPVYALTKEIQWRSPELFGNQKYFSLLGALHIEHCLLSIHGEFIKGSGLYEILSNNDLSIIGSGSLVNANHIKQARYCLQVSLCAVYFKLKDACLKSNSSLSPFEWLNDQSKHSQMCFYWRMIINLQIDILLFIRAIRESNFNLYIISIKNLMKWFFAMDHYHYARWCTVHLFDLMHMQTTSPDIYKEFSCGNFAFQKSGRPFSKMAPDQVHEQNNAVIKGTSGATHLLNRYDKSGLERWELCGHEMSRILTEFEISFDIHTSEASKLKHHEDTTSFQNQFSLDVKRIIDGMIYNPFQLDILTKINNCHAFFSDKVFKDLSNLLDLGQKQFITFWDARLAETNIAISEPIKKNSLLLLGKFEDQKSENQKKLVYSNDILNKLRSAAEIRKTSTLNLFKTELFHVAQSLAESSTALYHGNKADILKRFAIIDQVEISENSAAVVDLSFFVKGMYVANCKTFHDFAHDLYLKIMHEFKKHKRIDIIIDRYFQYSLKENVRDERGIGSRLLFDDNTKLPPNFQLDFLKNSANKDELGRFLGKRFIEFHLNSTQDLVVTYNDTILSSNTRIFEEELIINCSSEEADQRVIRHVLNLTQKSNLSSILACTYDTDVLILLIGYYPFIENSNKIDLFCQFGTGSKTKFYSINDIAEGIGFAKCRAIPFYHAFTGCDTVSSFYNIGKTKFWDAWNVYQNQENLTTVFQELSNQPAEVTDSHMDIIEDFVKVVYYPTNNNLQALCYERLNHFACQADANLRVIPPSRNGLTEHVKRAALQAGWIWTEARTNIQSPSPEFWGWEFKNIKYSPKWQSVYENFPDILKLCTTCTCKKALCKKCKCAKNDFKCLPFCSCHRKCEL